MPKTKVNSVDLNYEISGRGTPVVFINGLTMTVNGWALQVRAFSEKHNLVRYDCRGQGESDKPDEEYTQEQHAQDLCGLLDTLNIEKTHIVGISNGGMIAQHFALNYPEKLGALVLVDTCSYVDNLLELIVNSWIEATRFGGGALRYDVSLPYIFSESFIKSNLDKIQAMKDYSIAINPDKAVINLACASNNHNLKEKISEINAPTLIMAGEEDILIPPKYSKILRDRIPNSKMVTIKDCGHVPPIEKPEEFNNLVLRFLKKHDHIIG